MNPKTIFISAFFLFASTLCLRAQVAYEYMAVTYSVSGSGYYIGVSAPDNFVETKGKSKFDSKGYSTDLTLLVAKVNELAKENWEVYSTSTIADSGAWTLTYHLRRKKP